MLKSADWFDYIHLQKQYHFYNQDVMIVEVLYWQYQWPVEHLHDLNSMLWNLMCQSLDLKQLCFLFPIFNLTCLTYFF